MKNPAGPEFLNARRDAYVRGMRALVERFREFRPRNLKGILGRADSVLDAQLPALERLAAVDLDGEPESRLEVAEILLRAQHLPRMILAFGRVLLQEGKSRALGPLEEEALLLGRDLALLAQEWVFLHESGLDELEDEFEDDLLA